MTRCYEFYCMDKKCRTAEMSRTKRFYIDKFMTLMEDNDVLFDKSEEDMKRFYRMVQKYGSEREYCQVVQHVEQEPIISPPDGKYDVIVVDPPWPCESDVVLGTVHHYRPMTLEQIESLEIPAADDCVLWLWALNNLIHEAYHVLDAWGFTPRTVLTWVKNRFGTGYWLRGQTEQCILATKGKPVWINTKHSTILAAEVREHSRKPDKFYALVDSICHSKKLDMFSREKREGWEQWGDEVDKF